MLNPKTPELVGGVLYHSEDPLASAERLAQILHGRRTDNGEFDPGLLAVLRENLNPETIDLACALGGAWVQGRRSLPETGSWDLVATVPAGAARPPGVGRTTAETIVSLCVRAKDTVRIAAPFINETGLSLVEDAVVAATNRGVAIEILLSDEKNEEDSVLGFLFDAVRTRGDPNAVSLTIMRDDGPWSHMKVVVADSWYCYIGSANLTGAGLGYRNLELGVLVKGERVAVVNEILDLFKAGPAEPLGR